MKIRSAFVGLCLFGFLVPGYGMVQVPRQRTRPATITPAASPFTITVTPSDAAPSAGAAISYTIAVKNVSGALINNVFITDPLPGTLAYVSCSTTSSVAGECSFTNNSVNAAYPSAGSNETITLVVNVNITCNIPTSSVITNTATVEQQTGLGAVPEGSASAVVTITDNPPVITCPADLTVTAPPGQCQTVVEFPTPVATTNCQQPVSVSCVPPAGSIFLAGTTPVVCTAITSTGATARCTFNVIVNTAGTSVSLQESNLDFGLVNLRAAHKRRVRLSDASNTLTAQNTGCVPVTLSLQSILRTGSDVANGNISNADDTAFFSLEGDTSPIGPGTTRTFTVIFHPSIPAVASSTTGLSADQVLPDHLGSVLTLARTGGPALSVGLTAQISGKVTLIDPVNPGRPPVVTFARSGDTLTVDFSVFDSDMDVQSANYDFLDNSGNLVTSASVNLASAVQKAGLVRGQSFTVEQSFSGGNNNPQVTSVRVRVTDGQGTTNGVTSSAAGSTVASQSAGPSRPFRLVMPPVNLNSAGR